MRAIAARFHRNAPNPDLALKLSSCRQQRLPHGLSMMLGHSVALKGCATRPGKPASALDRDAVAKQMAVMPLWQNGHPRQNSD
jgi:hypothetical protein